jgi:hypothetical protein
LQSMRILMTDWITKQYLQIFIYFLMIYDKVVQNCWRVGWVVISRKYFSADVIQFCLQVTQWYLLIQAGNYADEMVKPDWSIFPHAWEEIWQWFVVNSALRFARVWSHGSQIDLSTSLCTPGNFAQLYSSPNACFINLSL